MKFHFELLKNASYIILLMLTVSFCQSQTIENENRVVGGPCEGCEAIFEYGGKILTPVDTLPKFEETEPKLKISGTIYHRDGISPAEDVILYIYHTNRSGIYETQGDEQGWSRRHGYIRGWIKTGKDGTYTFYTFRPASYPNRAEPEHIHMTIKEPNRTEYYIDDILFKDDNLLTNERQNDMRNRGGSGIVDPITNNGYLSVRRDIILGLNIPNYE